METKNIINIIVCYNFTKEDGSKFLRNKHWYKIINKREIETIYIYTICFITFIVIHTYIYTFEFIFMYNEYIFYKCAPTNALGHFCLAPIESFARSSLTLIPINLYKCLDI